MKIIVTMIGIIAGLTTASATEIIFPNDPRAVIDVKRDCGAKGDGIADDTAALQSAIERTGGRDHSRFIYLPNGTYRLTCALVLKPTGAGKEGSMVGPWLYGQERDRTIIRLADGAEGFGDPAAPREMVRGVSRPDGARMNADFFDRTIVNLTLDTGKNRGAVGIKYYSNNTGLMRDVLLRGDGVCGLDLGFNDQNGPLLIQDVEIEGFTTGIRTGNMLNSQTLSRVMGFGFVRILGGTSQATNYPDNLAKFVVDADPQGAKTVLFEHLQVFAPVPSFGIEARAPERTVVCRTTGGTVIARRKTRVFMSNCVGHCYQEPESVIWSRQLNTENGPNAVRVNTRNDGGQLWILGMKTEAKSIKLATLNGGRSEVLGVHNYNTSGVKDEEPFFRVENAALSVAGYREVCFSGAWWKVPVLAVADAEESRQPSRAWQTWSLLRAGK